MPTRNEQKYLEFTFCTKAPSFHWRANIRAYYLVLHFSRLCNFLATCVLLSLIPIGFPPFPPIQRQTIDRCILYANAILVDNLGQSICWLEINKNIWNLLFVQNLFFFTGKLVYVLRLYFIETTFLFLVPSKKFDSKFYYISYLYYLILINFIILGICLICVFWKYINILHISVIKAIFWDTINACKKVKNSLTNLYKCVIYKWQD